MMDRRVIRKQNTFRDYVIPVEEVRLEFAREAFLSMLRAGSPCDISTWAKAEWAADQAFPR